MAKYYAGLSEGDTLDSMISTGSSFGVYPSQGIDCGIITATTSSIGIATADNLVVYGISTATTFKGNLEGNVTGNLGGNVTGNLEGNVTGNLGGNVTGIITGGLTFGGVGIASTGARDAGVGTATGTVIYNSDTDTLNFYTPTGWKAVQTTPA